VDYLISLATDPVAWVAFATLVVMEVVLGIDNLIFISILTNKLPPEQQPMARRIGIGAALILRLVLLFSIAWIVQLTAPVLTILGNELSWRDFILIGGGLFLVWKATREIHEAVDPSPELEKSATGAVRRSMFSVVAQILMLDLVFSIRWPSSSSATRRW